MFKIIVIAFLLMIYLVAMYIVKIFIDFIKMAIDWKILRYLIMFFTFAFVIGVHYLAIKLFWGIMF